MQYLCKYFDGSFGIISLYFSFFMKEVDEEDDQNWFVSREIVCNIKRSVCATIDLQALYNLFWTHID